MSFLKPKPSTSENVNNSLITSTYGGTMNQGVGATNYLAQLLGVSQPSMDRVGGGLNQIAEAGGANAGYQNYLRQAGFAPAMRQMSQAVTGQGAAAGLLNSGSTAKALQSRGAEINQGFFNNYLQQLTGLSGLGLQAGGLVANTGQKSTGASPSTAGSIASTIGGIASIFSDRRLKHAIRKVGEYADGLGIYIFSYLGSNDRIKGVMADEVAKLRPWALGPRVGSFQTVNYGAL
jgi:hypothetical protein